ncbi:metal-sulfur cluster assembly factor [Persephonella atlantica]|uniref:Metal-sulfur cluster assembly factor n=1 Tax=Persephonella atlantica TaxID=2699429 RepID=A0ABS1GF20_9AQUI|nr:metal-sulfur cluster assembly factor [Persephonella atlantica]MBK3331529.1 metal-sulfur cluster assembly factor [Persephonella atlantica]
MTEIDVINALKEVYDPEIPLNIVDLGLVKSVNINDNRLKVIMTLTTPQCPLEKYIIRTVIKTLHRHFPQLDEISVNMDFSEPWNAEKISPEGKEKLRELGWNL